MRKVTAIFFLVVITLSTTQFYQVGKIPALIYHYFDHKQTREISIAEYFRIHYGKPFEFDKDWQKDMQLPFNNIKDHGNITIVAPKQNLWFSCERPFTAGHHDYILPPTIPLPPLNCSDIWQPPRC